MFFSPQEVKRNWKRAYSKASLDDDAKHFDSTFIASVTLAHFFFLYNYFWFAKSYEANVTNLLAWRRQYAHRSVFEAQYKYVDEWKARVHVVKSKWSNFFGCEYFWIKTKLEYRICFWLEWNRKHRFILIYCWSCVNTFGILISLFKQRKTHWWSTKIHHFCYQFF